MGFSRSEVLVYLPALGLRLALATCAWWALGCRLAGAKSALAAAHRGAPPAAAAAVRTAAFGFLAVSCVAEQLGSLAQVPAEMLHPPPPFFQAMYALPGAGALLGAPAVLVALHAAALMACVAAAAGWRSRLSLPAATMLYFVFGGLIRVPFKFFHEGLTPMLIAAVLACDADAAAATFSADALARRVAVGDHSNCGYRARPIASTEELQRRCGWLKLAAAALVAWLYLAAGVSKLVNGGPFWFAADNMRNLLLRDSSEPMGWDWGVGPSVSRLPDVILNVMGLGAMCAELGYVLVLVPWLPDMVRLILPLAMAGMHVGIFFAQNILFGDMLVLNALMVFLLWLERKEAAVKAHRGHVDQSSTEAKGRSLFAVEEDAVEKVAQDTDDQLPHSDVEHAVEVGDSARKGKGNYGAGSKHEHAEKPATLAARALFWMLLALGASAAVGLEAYPLTSVQMYSFKDVSGTVLYHELLEMPGEVKSRPEESVAILKDGRYRRALRSCFEDGSGEAAVRGTERDGTDGGGAECRALLELAARTSQSHGTTWVEARQVRWVFRSDPYGDNREIVARRIQHTHTQ